MSESENSQSGKRILVYLLLDVSGSMFGQPLNAVEEGVELLVSELRTNPKAEVIHLCVIAFGSQASVITPLTPINQFELPSLQVGGSTNISEALTLVQSQIQRDFKHTSVGSIGDFKPVVFLFTDGAPNNLAETIRARHILMNLPGIRIGTFLAIGCGPGIQEETLKQIAPTYKLLQDMSSETIHECFKSLAHPIILASETATKPIAESTARNRDDQDGRVGSDWKWFHQWPGSTRSYHDGGD